jgi:hypothetical protein
MAQTSKLNRPLRKAQLRLWLARWMNAFGWGMTIAAGVILAAVLIERLYLGSAGPTRVLGLTVAGATALALLVSCIWTLATRESLTTAAARLDVAAGLRERLSTGLYCRDLSDPFAQAVVADAERVGSGLTVRQHLPVRAPRSAPYAGGTLLLALMFFWLFPAVDLSGKQQQKTADRLTAERAQRTQAIMRPIIDQQVREVAERNPALKKDLEKLDPLKDAKLETPQDVRREMVKQLEKLSEQKDKQRSSEQMAKAEEFQKMMRPLGDQGKENTPAGELAKSLAKGDFKQAQEAIKNIELELSKAPKTPEDKQKAEELKQQLQQLSKKIDKLAQDQKKAESELKNAGLKDEEIKRALESLSKKDMKGLEKQLKDKGLKSEQIDKLVQQMKKAAGGSGSADKLAQQLAKAAKGAGENGQLSDEAKQGLQAAGEQLSEMESLQQQMNELNSSVADINNLKDKMGENCSACNGTGGKDGKPCSKCGGSGQGGSEGSGGGGSGAGMGSMGRGEGGYAQGSNVQVKTVQQHTAVKTLPGKIISQQFVNGEQYKGEASRDFVDAAAAAQRDVSDAIAKEQIPRPLQGPIGKYFTRQLTDPAPAKP